MWRVGHEVFRVRPPGRWDATYHLGGPSHLLGRVRRTPDATRGRLMVDIRSLMIRREGDATLVYVAYENGERERHRLENTGADYKMIRHGKPVGQLTEETPDA